MIEHTPLDVAQLSPAAQKALAPGPGKMMASRGMAPLPPADQLSVLYQITLDGDQNLAKTARETAAKLPDSLLAAALVNSALDRRVIDFFAQLTGNRPNVFDAIVQNPSIADETLAVMAGKLGAREVERIAANEQRMLRHPQIIAAMYMNKHARMSTVDRAVELAVRNNVRVPGLAAWDEIARALQSEKLQANPEVDALFEQVVARSLDDTILTQGDGEQVREADEHEQKVLEETKDVPFADLPIPGQIRLATVGDAFTRGLAVRSPIRIVAMSAIKSPAITEFEAGRYASNHALSEDVIRYIASRREFTKQYGTKYALCRNPKTPISESMRLLPFLREKDVVQISKSKGVPSAVVAQARKLLSQRRGGKA
ncbi:MAG TPA: hypothetical protein VIV11_31640 [Kofleriaceae bacterium]